MSQKHFPGETLGIIGSSISSAILAQMAGKIGYRVGSLVLTEDNPVRQFASWQTVSPSYNEQAIEYFGNQVDAVIIERGLLSHQYYHQLSQITDVILSEDLMAITTDRLIEKAYLDKHNILVAPYSLVTSISDVKEAVEYIGFPAVVKSTQRHTEDAYDHLIVYSEADYDQVEAKLDQGSCILEAWIPTAKRISMTTVRNERGQVLIYPAFEVIHHGDDQGQQVRYPANVDNMVEQEMFRIGQTLSDSLSLIGGLTLTFLVTSAGVIYLNDASVGLSDEAIFTIGAMSVSHFEAVVRAVMGLPLPTLRIEHHAAISYPMSSLDQEAVLTQFMLRTDWGFALFNPVKNHSQQLIGQVIVTGDSLESCERQVDITNLLARD